ncbi:hypothetical protein AnigIFM56816_007882 [Aspergillus niger]|nr:hypothetical protein AnigIFM56816_007882 [Aspergillus niger]
MAQHGDVTDDCTVLWPESRAEVKLGQVHLHSVMEDNETEQKRIIFDSVPRVEGIEPSGDPLIDTRAAATEGQSPQPDLLRGDDHEV